MSSRKGEQEQLKRIQSALAALIRKGHLEVLWHLEQTGDARYFNDIRRYALENRIVESRATVTTIVGNLKKLGLLEREVTDSTPPRARYSLTKEGKAVIDLLKELERQTIKQGLSKS